MKYNLILLTIVFLSCSKENNVAPLPVDELVVNNVKLTGTTEFAVGQVLKITPSIANERPDLDFSWTLSPNENEQIQINNSLVSWRPSKPQQYTLAVNAQSSAGEQGSKEYILKVIPADIRYYLWGTRRQDVEVSESASLSEQVAVEDGNNDNFSVGDHDSFDAYIVHQTEMEYAGRDALQPGESVGYWFDKGVLVAADVYSSMVHQSDPDAFYKKYEELKHRLSDYNYLGNEHKWLETNEEAMQLKNTPERWGEAFSKGYVNFHDRFENERSNILLESYGPSGGSLLIVIRYSQKK